MYGDKLIGQKFGTLLLSEKIYNNSIGRFMYKVICDCGATYMIRLSDLRRKKNLACGCHVENIPREPERINRSVIDKVGESWNGNTLLKITGTDPSTGEFKCSCGNLFETSIRSVVRNYKKSCGCKPNSSKIDLTGQKIGRWYVLEKLCQRGEAKYRCKCECGTEKVVKQILLRRGCSVSCGCYSKEKASEVHLRYKDKDLKKLVKQVRSCITQTLKNRSVNKVTTSETLLTISYEELINIIGPKPGDNYHIDHIIPVSLAKNTDEVLKLQNYKNLQWLPATENLRKSAKITNKARELSLEILGRSLDDELEVNKE